MSNRATAVSSSGGVGVLGLLGVLFVALKLTGHIDWSWFWVTLPFWGGLALVLGLMIIFLLLATVAVSTKRRHINQFKEFR